MKARIDKRLPRVALVGRPNVGKSSLFNRLLGRREAIVHDRAGVTRDRIQRETRLGGRELLLEDTGGLVPDAEEDLLRVVTRQALAAASQAQLALLMVDGRAGVTPLDETVAELLRSRGIRVIVVVNKIDVPRLEDLCGEAWRLGLGEPVGVSAEHSRGIDELIERIVAKLPPEESPVTGPAEDSATSDLDLLEAPQEFAEALASERSRLRFPDFAEEELQIAIVGRPNVGKSSIVNRLLGEERISVSALPGTTRDAVDVVLRRDNRSYRLIDTAGLRRRTKVVDKDEAIGIMLSRRRIERCHVAVLVLDATAGPTTQDVGIAGEIASVGRPFLIALNKWDLVSEREQATKTLDDALTRRLQFARYAPRVSISARTGQRVFKVLDVAREIAQAAGQEIRSSELNRFLSRTLQQHTAVGGSAPKVFYMAQTGILPPTFALFCRDKSKVTAQMKRFLESRLRESFGLGPTPVVINFRSTARRKGRDGPKK